MKVRVLFFASLREEIGSEGLELTLPDGSTTDSLVGALSSRLGSETISSLKGESVRVAVNLEMLDGAVELHDNDEVAYFPPVTGG